MFTPEMQKDGGADRNSPASFELYTAPARGKPDGLALTVVWRSVGPRERTVYEVYAMPPEVQVGPKKPFEGHGNLTVRRTETTTTASFRAETKRGVRIEGRLECPATHDD
jgi:hypothetical protein